jgi:hypothetical protein
MYVLRQAWPEILEACGEYIEPDKSRVFLSLQGEWRRVMDLLGERRLGAASPVQGSRHIDVSLSVTDVSVSWATDIQPFPGHCLSGERSRWDASG